MQTNWVNINEKLPPKSGPYLVTGREDRSSRKVDVDTRYFSKLEIRFYYYAPRDRVKYIQYWAELPKLPKFPKLKKAPRCK